MCETTLVLPVYQSISEFCLVTGSEEMRFMSDENSFGFFLIADLDSHPDLF